MNRSPGSRFGPYEVIAPLGRGGMGEVYRARDPRLKREVAIKVLPAEWASDAERRARFRREAELLATLNHPNVGAIYGLEESDGASGLVLELVEGPTLADRLDQGPLPLDEALEIARQIADALDAAHEGGIVHRDLKPDNVKVRQDGTVKVLDFGLAKVAAPRSGEGPDSAPFATRVGGATHAGVVLGTPRYMSPEQAHGQSVDKRTDIWAFGCVLFEMLAGRPVFAGSSAAAVLAAILEREPEWQALPSSTPASVQRLLRRCLEKDPKRRARDIGDVRAELEETLAASDRPSAASRMRRGLGRRAALGPWAWGAIALLAVGFFVWLWQSGPSPVPSASQLVVRQLTNYGGDENSGVISPDGRTFAFVSDHLGTPDIWLRQVSGGEPVRLTDDGVLEQELAFAPDGESIYFTRTEEGIPAIWQTGILGGPARKVIAGARATAPAPDGRRLAYLVRSSAGYALVVSGVDGAEARELVPRVGGFRPAWAPGGRSVSYIRAGLFAPQNLFVVEVSTGRERQVTSFVQPVEGIGAHAWLPGDRYLAASYLPYARSQGNYDLAVVDTRGGAVARVTASPSESFSEPSVSRDGSRLIVTSTRTNREVWRVPLTSPDPAVNGRGATQLLDAATDAMWTFVSRDGRTLLYAGSASGSRNLWTMALDRSERPRQVTDVPGDAIGHASLAPDGTRVAFVSFEGGTSDIWVQNVDGSSPRRLTADGAADSWPVWSPDGERIVYTASAQGAIAETRVMSADGTGNVKLIDGFFRGDWIRRPDGEGTVIVTSLTGPRTGVRLIDPEDGHVIWERELPGITLS